MFFHARLIDLEFDPGPESLEVRLFDETEIPWEQIAFRTVEQTLRWYFEDRRTGEFGLRSASIRRARPHAA
jgi:hypothetical protein